MLLFVGLGNPGGKYAGNRHNIGFMALDHIADAHGFSPWKSRFQASLSEGRFGSDRVALLKPETFMNLSGQSVGDAMRYYKIDPADVIVFHDELDLAPGKLRVKQGGGHAGHNGLRSIHQHIGADYGRVRLGIGHPGHKDKVAPYVLSDFAKAEQGWLDDMLRGIADGAPALAAGDAGRFQNAVALRVNPPRSGGGSGRAPQQGNQGARSAPPKPPRPPKPASAPEPAASSNPTSKAPGKPAPSADPAPDDTRTKLQKLADKFR